MTQHLLLRSASLAMCLVKSSSTTRSQNGLLGIFNLIVKLQTIKREFLLLALCLGVICLNGCQRSLAYSPQGWLAGQNKLWQKSFEQYDIEISQLQGKTSDHMLSGTLTLNPKANRKFTFVEIVLLTKNQEIVAKRLIDRTVLETEPRKREHLIWLFDKPLKDIMEDPVQLKLTLEIEGQKDEILIPLNRDSYLWKNISR